MLNSRTVAKAIEIRADLILGRVATLELQANDNSTLYLRIALIIDHVIKQIRGKVASDTLRAWHRASQRAWRLVPIIASEEQLVLEQQYEEVVNALACQEVAKDAQLMGAGK